MNALFSNDFSDSHAQTLAFDESRFTCHCHENKDSEEEDYFKIQNIEIDIDTEGIQPVITIIPNYDGSLEYALSTSIDNADFVVDNRFVLDTGDSNDYHVIVKDELGVIYVHSKINLSYL